MKQNKVLKIFKEFFSSKFNTYLVLILILLGSLSFFYVDNSQQIEYTGDDLAVHFFYLPTCPHCSEQKPIYNELKEERADVQFFEIDASSNEGSQLFYQMAGDAGLDTSKRELKEESDLNCCAEDLSKIAVIDFYFPYKPILNQRVHVYFLRKFQGIPTETSEMRPEWFPLKKIPYKKMWKSDSIWLKDVVKGNKLIAEFYWKEDNKTVDSYTLHEVYSL